MTTTATATHRMTWWGVIPNAAGHAENAGDHDAGRDLRVPRTRHMRGGDWGWDVTCTCGWDSRIGGGTQAAVRRAIWDHRWEHGLLDEEATR